MKMLRRSAYLAPSLFTLVLLSSLLLSSEPAQATMTPVTTARYIAIDLGTLGGPDSAPNTPGISISATGAVVGSADTRALDPFPGDPGCLSSPCHVNDAFEWRNGVMTDLGALHGYSAGIFELNTAGVGVGVSETGTLDPLTGTPETHAVISRNGGLVDLGTLGGYESWAIGINGRGQVSGYASNATPDPYAQYLSPYPSATQWRATVWQGGKPRDLGTLGGTDSLGSFINEQGQVAGESFTDLTPNPVTGLPTMDPFRWQNGVMKDLGTLGGKFGLANWMNSSGQVVGQSDLPGDQFSHPFFWNGRKLQDLGTLGGNNGVANWISDNGTVVGAADIPGSQAHHGFQWENGTMRDLPPAGTAPCSNAYAVNVRDQAVGNDTDCQGNSLAAVLWEHGSAYDLNSLIGLSSLHLVEAFYISNNGEIACQAILPNGDKHVVLLVPTGLASAHGLSMTSGTGPTAPNQHAITRGIHDPRDQFATIRQRLATATGPRL